LAGEFCVDASESFFTNFGISRLTRRREISDHLRVSNLLLLQSSAILLLRYEPLFTRLLDLHQCFPILHPLLTDIRIHSDLLRLRILYLCVVLLDNLLEVGYTYHVGDFRGVVERAFVNV